MGLEGSKGYIGWWAMALTMGVRKKVRMLMFGRAFGVDWFLGAAVVTEFASSHPDNHGGSLAYGLERVCRLGRLVTFF